MPDTDWAFVRRLTDVIGKRSLLDPEAAKQLAINIVVELDMQTETTGIRGADYLGGIEISRWTTGWFKR